MHSKQPGKIIYTLQFVRFIAAVMVLLFHLLLYPSGYKGVDLFFVLSGFVMYYVCFVNKRPSSFTFLVNRLTKIFILYWISLLALFMVHPFTVDNSLFSTILLLPGHNSVLGVSWSLSYELYFYFLFAGIVYLLPEKYQMRILWLLLIASTIATLILVSFSVKNTFWNFFVGYNFWQFCLGILAARLFRLVADKLNERLLLLLLTISSLLFLLVQIPYDKVVYHIVYGPLSCLIVLFAAGLEYNLTPTPTVAKTFRFIGDSSYAIYLFGPVITTAFQNKVGSEKVVIILTTLVFSLLINHFLEKKLLVFFRTKIYLLFSRKQA